MNAEAATLRARSARSLSGELAFERLFRSQYPRVLAVARRVLNDEQEAEDVAQEVFLSFHRLHPADVGYAPSWLHEAAAHQALNRLRGRRRRLERELRQALTPAEPVPDPAAVAEVEENRRLVRVALARLRRKYAAALALRYSGFSYSEIAAALRISIGQVGTVLRRAEAELRKEVQLVSPE